MALTDKTMRLLLSAMGSPEARDELLSNIESIQSDEIAAGAITTDKLEDLAVTNAKVAAGISPSKVTVADGQIVVGNASNVGVSVALSGDATISNTGVLTLAADSVDSAEIADGAIDLVHMSANSVDSDQYVDGSIDTDHYSANSVTADKISDSYATPKLHRFTVNYTLLNASGFPALFGVVIPDNAIVTKVFYDVITTFAGDGDDGSTIKIGLEDQNDDVVAAIAINHGSNPWDAGIHAAIQDGAVANMIKMSAARDLAVTWTAGGTDTALTAGQMTVFVEYVQSI